MMILVFLGRETIIKYQVHAFRYEVRAPKTFEKS